MTEELYIWIDELFESYSSTLGIYLDMEIDISYLYLLVDRYIDYKWSEEEIRNEIRAELLGAVDVARSVQEGEMTYDDQ